jgi:hypothetical protein
MRPILGSLGGGGAAGDEDAAVSVASHLDRLASGARTMLQVEFRIRTRFLKHAVYRALANLDVEHKRVEQRLCEFSEYKLCLKMGLKAYCHGVQSVYLDFFDAYKFGGVVWSCYAEPSNL